MTLLTAAGSGSAILTPEQVQALVIEPLLNQAVATQVSTVVQTASTSPRFPIVKQDRVTTWVQEGAEITPSDADLDEFRRARGVGDIRPRRSRPSRRQACRWRSVSS